MNKMTHCAHDAGQKDPKVAFARKRMLSGVLLLMLAVLLASGYRYMLVRQLQNKVASKLSDPDSARFIDLQYVGPWSFENGILCGQVNAKNKMGGYAGYQHFKAFPNDVDLLEYPPAQKSSCQLIAMEHAKWWWIRW